MCIRHVVQVLFDECLNILDPRQVAHGEAIKVESKVTKISERAH